MKWFTDALLVNIGATAFRPDKTKVSNPQTLQNISVVLLKLCQPFINDPSRIDPGFVSSPDHHNGIFQTNGDNAVPRLNESNSTPLKEYNPTNTFIPLCFFLCTRSLHLSVVANAAHHLSIARQVNHIWHNSNNNDPQLNHILSIQLANEVSLLAPEMIVDTICFFNLSAGFLLQVEDESLPLMPEHMVEDICSFIVFVTRFAARDMEKADVGNIFRVVVKLLSPKYASVSNVVISRGLYCDDSFFTIFSHLFPLDC